MSALADALATVEAESCGLLDLIAVRPAEAADFAERAAGGDCAASNILVAVASFIKTVVEAPRERPRRCASCSQPIRQGGRYAVVLVQASRMDPTGFVSMAVCGDCATEPAEIREKAAGALSGIWPRLRPITITHPHGGHA